MSVALDLTAMALALVWLVGFFVYKITGTMLDLLPVAGLALVVTRHALNKAKDRSESRKWKIDGYDAEH